MSVIIWLTESFFSIQQTSGLPLKLSAKFQINMAMGDVKSMAHVEKFSHLTIPMLWFEIALEGLPERLEKRFGLYLNILPLLEVVGLYGTLTLGTLLTIIAVTQVALRTSKSMAAQKCHQKFNRNLVYSPCEEMLIDRQGKNVPQVVLTDETNKSDDESSINGGDCTNVITRSQYELEDDDALSDIEYSEEIDSESTSRSSMPVSFVFVLFLLRCEWMASEKTRFGSYFIGHPSFFFFSARLYKIHLTLSLPHVFPSVLWSR